MGDVQGILEGSIIPCSCISLIAFCAMSTFASGRRRGCRLIGFRSPVSILCEAKDVLPMSLEPSANTSLNSTNNEYNWFFCKSIVRTYGHKALSPAQVNDYRFHEFQAQSTSASFEARFNTSGLKIVMLDPVSITISQLAPSTLPDTTELSVNPCIIPVLKIVVGAFG